MSNLPLFALGMVLICVGGLINEARRGDACLGIITVLMMAIEEVRRDV